MLNIDSDKSIYIQIAEIIENDILKENIKAEEQAPSTNEFARVYNINPATARKGLNILVDEGILYKKRGMGMFVTQDGREKVLKKRQEIFLKQTLPEVIREAKRLEIDKYQIIKYLEELEEI